MNTFQMISLQESVTNNFTIGIHPKDFTLGIPYDFTIEIIGNYFTNGTHYKWFYDRNALEMILL